MNIFPSGQAANRASAEQDSHTLQTSATPDGRIFHQASQQTGTQESGTLMQRKALPQHKERKQFALPRINDLGEKRGSSPHATAEELQKADGAGDELGLCNHRAGKPAAERLLVWGTCCETVSVRQPMTAGFVPKPRNLCCTSLHHNFVLNLKYFNCLFNKAVLNYECLLKQKAATPWQFDGTLSSTGLFIFLLASEFLMQSGYP